MEGMERGDISGVWLAIHINLYASYGSIIAFLNIIVDMKGENDILTVSYSHL